MYLKSHSAAPGDSCDGSGSSKDTSSIATLTNAEWQTRTCVGDDNEGNEEEQADSSTCRDSYNVAVDDESLESLEVPESDTFLSGRQCEER